MTHAPAIVAPFTTLLVALMALGAAFFFPLTPDYYEFPKRMLILLIALLVLGLFTATSFLTKRIRITRTPFTFPAMLLLGATVASILLASPNRLMALTGNGGLYLAIAILLILVPSLRPTKRTHGPFWILMGTGVLVSLLTILDLVGVRLLPLLAGFAGRSLDPATPLFATGGPIVTVAFLGLTLAMGITRFLTKKTMTTQLLVALSCAVMAIGLIIAGSQILPGKPFAPQFLSFLGSWSIALDVSKNPTSALFGVGTDSYQAAFRAFRPVSLNLTDQWMLSYTNARSLPFDVFTTMGAFGLLAWGLIALAVVRTLPQTATEELPLAVGLGICLLYFLFFPVTTTMLITFTVLLVTWASNRVSGSQEPVTMTMLSLSDTPTGARTIIRTLLYAVVGGLSALILLATYGLGRVVMAEISFGGALAAARQSDAKGLYDNTVQAIRLNPVQDQYRRSFALTNLSVAQALTQKESLTDQEQQTAVALIQQAISEAKAAVALDPTNIQNWNSLTSVYRALVGSVDQADQWTIASMIQTIQRSPSDPLLRLNLAGIYRQLGNTDQAIRLLEQAIQLKPNYANAYYNLSDIYKAQGNKEKQLAMLAQTLTVLPESDPDRAAILSTAEALKTELESATPSARLVSPAPQAVAPTATPQAQLNLPQEAGMQPEQKIPEVPQE